MALKILHTGGRKKIRDSVKFELENGADTPQFSYGKFPITYAVNFQGLSLSVDQEKGMYHYRRALGNWKTEKNVSMSNGSLLIHPVEPLNLPDNVTDFLEIGFDPIMIEPEGRCVVFVTMPIEIGVFIESESGETEVLDIVSYIYPKYSMYGNSSRGVITRHHTRSVYYYPPNVRNYQSGLLKLEIENRTNGWVNIGRVVLYQKGLFLYFDEHIAASTATVVITSPDVATVTGIDYPIREGMTPANRVFVSRKITPFYNVPGMLNDTVFTMDMGLI